MASPGNQHCANCIGTLSFPITVLEDVLVDWHLKLTEHGIAGLKMTLEKHRLWANYCAWTDGVYRATLQEWLTMHNTLLRS